MHNYLIIFFTFILIMTYFGFIQASFYANKNNLNKDYKLQSTYINTNTAAIENREIMHHLHHNKLKFHNTPNNLAIRDNQIEHLKNSTEKASTYSPPKYTIVDYNNVDVVYNKRSLDNSQQQLLENIYDLKQRGRSSLLKQLESQKQELSRGYTVLIYDPYQLTITPKEKPASSNDHYKTRYLASYVTPSPSPSHSEMHPNLHHNIPHINYKNPTIVSHATGNEPSPMTTTSIKSLTSIENMQHFLTTVHGLKYNTNNELNDYDSTAEDVPEFNKSALKPGSKQYLYAPMRPSLERELPLSSNTLPYPPSFIFITTTEKPLINFNSVRPNIPDLFTHRQSKSLWDSYIPSWQITKMMQQLKNKPKPNFNNKNNLQTLAFTRQYKIEREKLRL